MYREAEDTAAQNEPRVGEMDASAIEHRSYGNQIPALMHDQPETYCPECGQSLDLSRHMALPTGQRTLEACVFALFGLVFVVLFAVNGWYTHRAMLDIDQQIVDSWASIAQDAYGSPSDQERAAARTLNSFLTERLPIQQRFDHDVVGVAFGVMMVTLGVGTLIRQRRERGGLAGPSCRGLPTETLCRLWDLGRSVTTPFVWTVVLLCVGVTVDDIIRGEPLTLELLGRALERTVTIVVATISALS